MTTFDDRTKGHEGAFAHNEQLSFALEAKMCKHFGLWIAEKLGLDGKEAELYAADVVYANLEEAGHEDVFRKVRPDLDEKNITYDDDLLHAEMDNALHKAKAELAES